MACDPKTSQALIEALFTANSMGLCLFDPDGRVRAIEGAALVWAPPIGSSLFESILFVGMEEAIGALRGTTQSLLLSGVSMGADDGRAFDLRVLWVDGLLQFAAASSTATERNQLQSQAFQSARDSRLLEQKILEQQEKIVEQAQLMDLFIKHVPASVAMLDSRLEPMMLSQRWIEAFGDPSLGDHPDVAGSPLRMPDIDAALRLALDTGVTSSRVARVIERGAPVWKRWEQTPWRRADRSVGGTILFFEDVTDEMRASHRLRAQSEDLRRLDSEIRTLANALADDIAGPLAQLDEIAASAATDAAVAVTDARRERLMRTRASVDKLKSMLHALQNYVEITTRRIVLSRFDLADAVERAGDRLADEIRRAGARIVLHPTLSVAGDLDLMTQVFSQVIANALRHAGGAPTITIDCLEDDNYVTVRVTDDGPGIPAHLHARALAPFGRLESADEASAGIGMGLAMARKIVELHGGTLALDPGFELGLRVVINLPRDGVVDPPQRAR